MIGARGGFNCTCRRNVSTFLNSMHENERRPLSRDSRGDRKCREKRNTLSWTRSSDVTSKNIDRAFSGAKFKGSFKGLNWAHFGRDFGKVCSENKIV